MRLLTLFLALTLGSGLSALPAGVSILPEDSLAPFALKEAEIKAKISRVDSPPQGLALQLETLTDAENPWDIQVQQKTVSAIKTGDVLLASFYVRCIKSLLESGEAETRFVVELAKEPWDKIAEYPVRAGKDWTLINFPFKSDKDFAAGEAQVIFRMGFRRQNFQVAGLKVLNFGTKVTMKDLPTTKVSYQGREANAPWRAAAEARISANRMGPLNIKVVDATGQAVSGAEVSVVQTKNAFMFGSAFSGHFVYRSKDAGKERYTAEFKRLFNAMVEENAFKWPPLAGEWDGGDNKWGLPLALQSANFAKDNGQAFRGHVLFWPSWNNSPKYLKKFEKDPAALRAEVLKHVRETAAASNGLAKHWDVVNEPFDNHDISDLLGDKILPEVFAEARKANPTAQLYINDYAILAGGSGDTAHRRHYEKTITSLLKAGAPVQGIGMQGHFGWSLTGMNDATQLLDRYAKLIPHISITEYDIDIDDLDLAGDYLRDLLTLIYSHPACDAFMMWGFWDGAHWHKKSPLFNLDWSPKPALAVWEDLVLKKWRTQAQGKSDAQGGYSVRGHKGDYVVTVKSGGKTAKANVSLVQGSGAQVEVRLP